MKKGQKRNWTLPLKILYSIVVSCVFAVPAMIGYALKLQVTRQNFFSLGVYGLIVFTFIFLQLTFATLNRYLVYRYKDKVPPIQPRTLKEASTSSDQVVIELTSTNTRLGTKIGLAVVGYREEPSLFTQCLESVKTLEYPDPFKIVVVIDGDEDADREMAALFQKTFPDAPIVVLPELLSTSFHKYKADFKQKRASSTEKVDEQENVGLDPLEAGFDGVLQESLILPTDTRAVCYIQPHCGKRHAMYTAFRVLMASGCEAVMSTDSDTKFDPKAMMEMEQALYWFPRIGAAAGDVRIWNNKGSLLSFMSSLRYWMAFNIERAAQSFNRCVTCVSGPMGIYRSHVLREILDDWINQTFLGLECTYGDDR
jgi:hyaluronan synthase